jgi:hypothetical protein
LSREDYHQKDRQVDQAHLRPPSLNIVSVLTFIKF